MKNVSIQQIGVNEKYYSQRGDIYIALSGATTGKIGIMDASEKYVINQRVGIVRQKSDDIPQEYIKYFLLRQLIEFFKRPQVVLNLILARGKLQSMLSLTHHRRRCKKYVKC